MAHQIELHDQMFSVRQKPWHGLGNIIMDYPTIPEAIAASGLNWTTSLKEMVVPMDIQGHKFKINVPNQFAIIRNDIHRVLGTVGNRYQIYQNSDMWQFIEEFQKQSGMKLETAGSLRNGQTTWVLAKNTCFEPLKGDPIEEYFLFKNSFDGCSPISCMFTNIRVVCNNTLTAALRDTKNIFNVRHTKSASEQIKEVQKALLLKTKYQHQIGDLFEKLTKIKMNTKKTESFVSEIIFPAFNTKKDNEELSQKAETRRKNKIEQIISLVDSGTGTNIPGVKGTAYGLFNALTEWSDHEKTMKVGEDRDEKEVRFENVFFGTGSKFKADCFNELIKLAA